MTTSKGDTKNIVDFSSVSYVKILVPHDTTEMSDKALAHAIYISKMTGAQIELFYVHEHYKDIPPSTILALIGPDRPLEKAKEELKNAAETGVRKILEEKVRICKEEGKIDRVSYKIEAGKPVDEIVRIAEENNYDLIIMASSRISSSIRLLGSTAKGVIDSIRSPVMIIHEQSLDTVMGLEPRLKNEFSYVKQEMIVAGQRRPQEVMIYISIAHHEGYNMLQVIIHHGKSRAFQRSRY